MKWAAISVKNLISCPNIPASLDIPVFLLHPQEHVPSPLICSHPRSTTIAVPGWWEGGECFRAAPAPFQLCSAGDSSNSWMGSFSLPSPLGVLWWAWLQLWSPLPTILPNRNSPSSLRSREGLRRGWQQARPHYLTDRKTPRDWAERRDVPAAAAVLAGAGRSGSGAFLLLS